MKIYDISQELFSASVYEGDPSPSLSTLTSMNAGDTYNLSAFSACAHNGTHVDAPSHFIKDGKTVGEMELEKLVGEAYVSELSGDISAEDATRVLKKANAQSPEAAKRILIKGEATVTESAAEAFLAGGVSLIGVESQSVGPINAPMAVHKLLLQKEVVLLEGIRLNKVTEGAYFLFSAPLNLGSAEGAPCRAVLVDFEN